MLQTKHTTFPLPQQEAERLVNLMREHEYTADLRQEGNGWAVIYEPPQRKVGQVFGKDILT
ncbi:MAG: hypothetical protein Q8R28_01190, partial [Dehalococcoidia bacterium]|nr:hypothetical protein [Dehalococcoidia bacterium]